MKLFKLLLITFGTFAIFSCSSDDDAAPAPVNEEEVITTVNLTLSPTTGSDIVLTSQDLDGEGPNDPVITAPALAANMSYTGTVELLNEMESPAEDITEEVAEEDDEHQFFFQVVGNATLTVNYTDMDADGNPIGINFTLTTGDASTGSLQIILRHLLDKNAAGVSDGDITNAGGSTDVDVTFPIVVQ
ncbi:type 1 periplasmic binding fold superfamily protein [Spongiimicrobium salis]|uniref:type 1 periplasmic binding fold superfamily protein n=1 Tax=Spongiimicrobium salis TaxID=1667022 RepID=UPI00374D9A6C